MTGPDLPEHGPEYPEPGQLADIYDELDWDRERDGRMRDYAAADDAVLTVPWEGED